MLKITKYIWVTIMITFITSVIAFLWLPPETPIPLHWDINGNIDREVMSHGTFFIMPAFQALIVALFAIVLTIEPRQKNVEKSRPAIGIMMSSTIMLLALVQFILISQSFKIDILGMESLFWGLGIVFIVLGNYMTKLRSSYFFGIRTPWTLSSDYVWKKTHRLAGKLFMLAGTIIFLANFFTTIKIMSIIVMATILPAALIPVIYSWVIWQRENKEKNQQLP